MEPCPRRLQVSKESPSPFRPPKDVPDPFPGMTERIQALTPEDMLDTAIQDARREENFKFAHALYQADLARAAAVKQESFEVEAQGVIIRAPEL